MPRLRPSTELLPSSSGKLLIHQCWNMNINLAASRLDAAFFAHQTNQHQTAMTRNQVPKRNAACTGKHNVETRNLTRFAKSDNREKKITRNFRAFQIYFS